MNSVRNPSDAIAAALEQLDADDRDVTMFRLAIATYTIALSVLSAFVTHYVKRAAKQAFALARTLAVLVVVYALYYTLQTAVTGVFSRLSKRTTEELISRGNVNERVSKAIGLVIFGALVYGSYRVMRWSVSPITERLDFPDPEQTSVRDYLNDHPMNPDDSPDDSTSSGLSDEQREKIDDFSEAANE